jgi:hypothetical protein
MVKIESESVSLISSPSTRTAPTAGRPFLSKGAVTANKWRSASAEERLLFQGRSSRVPAVYPMSVSRRQSTPAVLALKSSCALSLIDRSARIYAIRVFACGRHSMDALVARRIRNNVLEVLPRHRRENEVRAAPDQKVDSAIRKSSIARPAARSSFIQRGCRPRPDHVIEGSSGFRNLGSPF